jgi:hypothetical protein
VIAGVTGSGKSFYSKLLLVRSAAKYTDLQVNIVDPKDEYNRIAEELEDHVEVNKYHDSSDLKGNVSELGESIADAYKHAQEHSGKTVVVIDEAHRLLEHEEGASVLSTLVREARSSNTAVTLITQTINDFYKTEAGQDILKNIPCKALFAHEQADSQPGSTFGLSNIAENSLYTLTKGDQDGTEHSNAVLSVSNQFESKIKVEPSTAEKLLVEYGETCSLEEPQEDDEEIEASTSESDHMEHEASEGRGPLSTIKEKVSDFTLPTRANSRNLPNPGKFGSTNQESWIPQISKPESLEKVQAKIRSEKPLIRMGSHVALVLGSAQLTVLILKELAEIGKTSRFIIFLIALSIVTSALIQISEFYQTNGDETA